MEKEAIKAWPFMIGPQFQRDGRQLYIGFGFYWFKVMFFWKWHPHVITDCQRTPCPWTGFIFAYSPTSQPEEGDLLWRKTKEWLLRGNYAA